MDNKAIFLLDVITVFALVLLIILALLGRLPAPFSVFPYAK